MNRTYVSTEPCGVILRVPIGSSLWAGDKREYIFVSKSKVPSRQPWLTLYPEFDASISITAPLLEELGDRRPLQLDVIERAVKLWSSPDETVLDPFAGIGSVPYQAVMLDRMGIGIELKPSYYQQALKNLETVKQVAVPTLFDLLDSESADIDVAEEALA